MSDYKIIVLGPLGSGKGTQANMLAGLLGVPHIATGDIFREHIKDHDAIGDVVGKYLEQGELVPDEIVNDIVTRRLQKADCAHGFVIEGYPRNLSQAKFFDALTNITHFIELVVPEEETVKRLSARVVCICGATYNLNVKPPKTAGICDKCGKKLFVREDDRPETIQRRLVVYRERTTPVVNYYQKLEVYVRIDGNQGIDVVYKDILLTLGLEQKLN